MHYEKMKMTKVACIMTNAGQHWPNTTC